MKETTRLVADVGGTHSRIALYHVAEKRFSHSRHYLNRDYGHLFDILQDWLGALDTARPRSGCLAVAAPPAEDCFVMCNIDWRFSASDARQRFGFSRFAVINDFEANAYALPHLQAEDCVALRVGDSHGCHILATVGPGTGLGGATLALREGDSRARASEPGHMGLAPASDLELALWQRLLPQFGNVYAELLVSGPGLLRLYETLAALENQAADASSPAEVSQRALAGSDPLCTAALEIFCGLLGSVCGDFVLANGAYGGLYLAGGIVPRLIPGLQASPLLERFTTKGMMTRILAEVPVYAITGGQPGLLGAAHAPL